MLTNLTNSLLYSTTWFLVEKNLLFLEMHSTCWFRICQESIQVVKQAQWKMSYCGAVRQSMCLYTMDKLYFLAIESITLSLVYQTTSPSLLIYALKDGRDQGCLDS